VANYLDVLASTLMVRRLQPWHENLRKRQVKAPKIYLKDSGLLHALLGIESTLDLERHPKVGASWEGFALESVVAAVGARAEECFFWATHSGAELDLLWVRGRRRRGFEFKLSDAPRTTASMRVAMDDLKLDGLDVVHAGSRSYPMARGIRAVSIERIFKDLKA
jgi:predicted AAA+ superfamily ATPase